MTKIQLLSLKLKVFSLFQWSYIIFPIFNAYQSIIYIEKGKNNFRENSFVKEQRFNKIFKDFFICCH